MNREEFLKRRKILHYIKTRGVSKCPPGKAELSDKDLLKGITNMDLERKERITANWAETARACIQLSDEELIQRITEYELLVEKAQTQLEAARKVNDDRRQKNKDARTAAQREQDRKYIPKPADKIEFDKKARAEKVQLSAEEKAIQKMMSFGLSREAAIKSLNDAKGIK